MTDFTTLLAEAAIPDGTEDPPNPLDLPAHLEAIGRYMCTLADDERGRAEYDRVWESVHIDDQSQVSAFIEYWSKLQASPEAIKRARIEEEKERLDIREQAKQERLAERDAYLASEDGIAEAAARFAAEITDLEDLEDPEPLIHGFLHKDTLVRTFGPPKSLKSFVTLDMAACVSLGIDWQGAPTVKARVLYIVAEGGRGMRKRKQAWNRHHGADMAVEFYPRPVQISDREQMHDLIAYCRVTGVEYVIFDTQARCTVGVNENDNTEMGEIVSALDVLKQQTGACVHLVHHSVGNNDNKARGATAFDGAVDAEFAVKRDQGDKTLVSLVSKFQKDDAEADDVKMRTAEEGDSLVLVPAPDGSADTPPVEEELQSPADLPVPTEIQMVYLRGLNFYEKDSVSPAGLAAKLKEEGVKTYGQLCRNKLIELKRMELAATDPKDAARWIITPKGVMVIAREIQNRLQIEQDWLSRGPRRGVSQGVSGGQTKLADETS